MHFNRLPPFLAPLLAFILAGCGMQQIALAPTRGEAIRTVGVLTPAVSGRANILVLNNPIRGGLIGIIMQNHREDILRTVVAQEQFSVRDEFLSRLQAALRAKGLAVSTIPAARNGGDLLSRYPAGSAGVDALLDTSIATYGYIAPNLGTGKGDEFVPMIEVNVRLIDARTSEVLMQRTIEENPFFDNPKIVKIEATAAPSFETVSDMKKEPAQVIAGLQRAADQAASAVAGLVR